MEIFNSFENKLKSEINCIKKEYLTLEDGTFNNYIEEETHDYFLKKNSLFFENFPYFDILKKH